MISSKPYGLTLPKGMVPREEMESLLSVSSLLLFPLPFDVTVEDRWVQKPVGGTEAHTALPGMVVFAQATAAGGFSPQALPSASNHA